MHVYFPLIIAVHSVCSMSLTGSNNQSDLIQPGSLIDSVDLFNQFAKFPVLNNLIGKFNDFVQNATFCELCWMNSAEMCEHYGYKSDTYSLQTTDGYILTVFRCYKIITQKQPILLIHGALDSSDTWLITGNKSLAIMYVDMGYDIYLLNCRGNRYSKKHVTLSPVDPKFWNFSFTEIATYDIPNTIEMIRQKTGSPTIQSVGHSQGGTSLVALLSMNPEYNKIITHVGLLAPFTYAEEVGFPWNVVIETLFYDNIVDFEFLPHLFPIDFLSQAGCKIADGAICNVILNLLFGPSFDQIDPDVLAIIFCHVPAGTSSKVYRHFGQEYHCKYFGTVLKSPPPFCDDKLPSFDLSRITTGVSLYYSPNDPFTVLNDAPILIDNLSNADLEYTEIPQFNHIDFVWSKNAAVFIYKPLLSRTALFAQ